MRLQLTILLCLLASTAAATDFEREIAPLLVRRCVECHDEAKASGGLVLTTSAGLRKGGDSGATINSEQPEESLLLHRHIVSIRIHRRHDIEVTRIALLIGIGLLLPILIGRSRKRSRPLCTPNGTARRKEKIEQVRNEVPS